MKMKRILAAAVAALMIVALAGCSTPASVGRLGETEIPAGLYLLYQLNAYSEAKSHIEDAGTVKDVLAQAIDEVPAGEWIADKTMEDLQRYAGIQALSVQYGVELSVQDEDDVDGLTDAQWAKFGDSYQKNGIGKASVREAMRAEMQVRLLMDAIYGAEGTEAVKESELSGYMTENYADLTYFALPLMNEEYKFADEDQKAELEKLADEVAKRLNDGEKLETVADEAMEKAFDVLGSEVENGGANVKTTTVTRLNGSMGKEMEQAVFGAEVGEYAWCDIFTGLMVFRRDELKQDESLNANALMYLVQEPLEQKLLEAGKALENGLDETAVKTYGVKKIRE